MSAPDTNTEKQKKSHWPPLIAFALVVIFGVGIILYWAGEEIATAPEDGVANDPAAQQAEQDGSDATTSETIEDVEGETVNPGLDEETGIDN